VGGGASVDWLASMDRVAFPGESDGATGYEGGDVRRRGDVCARGSRR